MSESIMLHVSPLDQALLSACISTLPDYAQIEDLLRQGADPMGSVSFGGELRNLYPAVVDHYLDLGHRNQLFNDTVFFGSERYVSGHLAVITELFCKNGMDISKPSIPYDGDDILNPLISFSFYGDGHLDEPLKVLLDHGLSVDDAAKCWDYAFSDQVHVVGHLDDDFEREAFFDVLKKLFLIASYPHIWQNDPALRSFLEADQNNYDVSSFRDMDRFCFSIDVSTCEKGYPRSFKSTVTVFEIETGRPVWKFRYD